MLRSKFGLLGLCVMALSLMAFSAGSASAATQWLILNAKNEVKTGTELPATLEGSLENSDATVVTHLIGLSLGILCTSVNLENTKLEGSGRLTTGARATFTGCIVKNEATHETMPCTVKSPGSAAGTVVTKELKGQLQANGEIIVEPKEGETWVEKRFEGEECVLAEQGTVPVKGQLFIEDCEGKAHEHLVTHLLEETKGVRGHTLWLGKDTTEHLETEIDGSALVSLTGAHATLKWGADFP